MRNIFKKIIPQKEFNIETASYKELMDKVPHVSAMNRDSSLEFNKDGKSWLNPNNQECFNYGNYTLDEYRQWAKGTGPIVKGKNQKEKDEVMKYARAKEELDDRLFYYWEYLDLLDSTHLSARNSISGYFAEKYDIVDRKAGDKEIIKKIFSSHVFKLKADMEYTDIDKVSSNWKETWWGVADTIALLGIGRFGACNTPRTIDNLSWIKDLVFAKAYYLHLKDHEKYDFPNVEFVHKLRCK